MEPQTKVPQATQACPQQGDAAATNKRTAKNGCTNFSEISYEKTRGSYDHCEIAPQCQNDGGYAKVSAGGNPRPGLVGASLPAHRQRTLPSSYAPPTGRKHSRPGNLLHNRCHSSEGRIPESRLWGRLAIHPFHPHPSLPFPRDIDQVARVGVTHRRMTAVIVLGIDGRVDSNDLACRVRP